MLDEMTLRVVFALTALIMLGLFFSTFRTTRSAYSLNWTTALLFLLLGGSAYLLIGTPVQAVGLILGDALTVTGLVWSWRAARALRMRRLGIVPFIVPAVVVAVVTAIDSPATNVEAGAGMRFLVIALLTGLAAREVALLDSRYSRIRWSLLAASATLSAYYLFRLVAVLFADFGSEVVAALVSETTTTLITEIVLITVSFSMAGLSHDEVEQRLRARARKSSLELSEGAQVQQTLFPSHRVDGVQYPISGVCVASRSLSGDFFDWTADDAQLVITVGDVMGKGVGAAMLGATVRAGLRLARRGDPGADVRAVMEALGDDLRRNESFVTLFRAYLDRATSTLRVLDAGHGLAVIVRRDGTHEQITSSDLPLGLNIDQNWMVRDFPLEPGDRLLVFSDGVLDLFDGTVASLHRAADLALAPDAARTVSMDDAVARIRRLAEAGEREDDVTVVALERQVQNADVRPTIDR